MLVRCNDCALFTPNEFTPDALGSCRVYEHYLGKDITDINRNDLLRRLGNKNGYPLFWATTLIDRKCEKYKPISAMD